MAWIPDNIIIQGDIMDLVDFGVLGMWMRLLDGACLRQAAGIIAMYRRLLYGCPCIPAGPTRATCAECGIAFRVRELLRDAKGNLIRVPCMYVQGGAWTSKKLATPH